MAGEFLLRSGSRIAVIGGGPAGAFFALFAQNWARRRSLDVAVTIFDGKDFLEPGPRGCNLCAGVIAASLERKLRAEGLALPDQRIASRVAGYSLHLEKETLRLSCAENGQPGIATVFRGNGPRHSRFPEIISFDDYLLGRARDLGAQIIAAPVWRIIRPSPPSAPIALLYGERDSPLRYEADMIVGAFGLHTHLAAEAEGAGFGYRRPKTLVTYQAEFHLGRDAVREFLGNEIHVYLPRSRTLRYATVIPKGEYASVTLLGKKDATPDLAAEFFSLKEIRSILPCPALHCFCRPRIAVSGARHPVTDRLVLIGDAGFCRHYKNGIESAFLTAELAAAAAFTRGVDAVSLRSGYLRPARRLIVRDNRFGRVLFWLNDVISATPFLGRTHFALANSSRPPHAAKKIRCLLWQMFTGGVPYREIFWLALDGRLQGALLLKALDRLMRRWKRSLSSF